ncbi:MAG: nucleotidyl transferase AbiEii/AbiGii toxin family protein [Kiritimatiellae bacterium]|nr:nucleotidyl transferase AbiEii/AbiGii toxin family protein [Kiritimatiellia bacterium]
MTDTCIALLNPIEPERKSTLCRVAEVASGSGTPLLLCGAFARDVLFWNMHGIETRRETLDIDISVQITSWEAYERFGRRLLEQGFKNPYEHHPEKFRDEQTGHELDLLPFGELAEDGKTLIWPTDNSPWSVVGFQDAFENALYLGLQDGVREYRIRLVSIPALVMLKIVAAHDRPKDRYKKDSTDIGFVIEKYTQAGNKDRLKTPPHGEIMRLTNGDLDMAAAALLGRDLAGMVCEDTREYLLGLLEHEVTSGSRCYLARGLREGICKGDFTRGRQLLSVLARNLREWPASGG